MVQVSGARSATLRYDPLGRLYETSAGTAASITRMLYDGDELTAEYNASGTLLRRYVHGSGNDDPLIWYEGAGVASTALRRLRPNHQGSIVAVTDTAGAKLNINSYDEWGIPAAANIGRFQYTGQAWLPEIGMYYYKARIYSPTLGRFMQTDPIGYEDQVNLYAYVGNDPVNMVDPDGKEIVYFGTKAERKTLEQATMAVIATSKELRSRQSQLVDSKFTVKIEFGEKRSSSSSATTTPVSLVNAMRGPGSSSTVMINPEYAKPGYKDSQGRDLSTMIAHEVYGHAYDNARGELKRYEIDPKSGLPQSEVSAMAAENTFNKAAGRPVEKCYGKTSLDGKSAC